LLTASPWSGAGVSVHGYTVPALKICVLHAGTALVYPDVGASYFLPGALIKQAYI